jgi:hypothetical protein
VNERRVSVRQGIKRQFVIKILVRFYEPPP